MEQHCTLYCEEVLAIKPKGAAGGKKVVKGGGAGACAHNRVCHRCLFGGVHMP